MSKKRNMPLKLTQEGVNILNMVNRELNFQDHTRFSECKSPELLVLKGDKAVLTDSYTTANRGIDYSLANDLVTPQNLFKGYPYLAFLSQNGIMNAIISTLADEALSNWITLRGENDQAKVINYCEQRFKELDVRNVLRNALRINYTYGGAAIFFDFDDPEEDLHKEWHLVPGVTVAKDKKLRYVRVLEPFYCVPTMINTSHPLEKDFFVPSIYQVYNTQLHASRLKILITHEVTLFLKPLYNYFGFPLIQLCEKYVERYEETAADVFGIVKNMKLLHIQTNLMGILAPEHDEAFGAASQFLLNRIRMIKENRDNSSVLLTDKETEGVEQFEMTVSGLNEILTTAMEQMCIIPKLPATKLLGITPAGMNQAGESDLNNFDDEITKVKENYLRHIIDFFIDIFYAEFTGKENNGRVRFEFNQLHERQMQESRIKSNEINDISILKGAGIIDTKESRNMVSDLGYNIDPNKKIEVEAENDDIEQKIVTTPEQNAEKSVKGDKGELDGKGFDR